MTYYWRDLRPTSWKLLLPLAVLLLRVSFSYGQVASGKNQTPTRFNGTLDETHLVTLKGHLRSDTNASSDLGQVAPMTFIHDMTIWFRPSGTQSAALDQLLLDQHDPHSKRYHNWLSASDFGSDFGLQKDDIRQIAAWLQSYGFQVSDPPPSLNWLRFSGTAAQIHSAFHTDLHYYFVNGKREIANATSPMIPAALSNIVSSITGLNTFTPHADATTGSGKHYLAPSDLSVIYDISPFYSQGYDGSNQTVVVIGQSDLDLSDVSAFRSRFGLSSKLPTKAWNGSFDSSVQSPNPGVTGDQGEADLDLEWLGAIAPNANIEYVYSSNAFGAVQSAVAYRSTLSDPSIISMSFGICELDYEGYQEAYEDLAKQANTEGITWIASSGDSGAAGCDPHSLLAANQQSVELPASIPEVTAVGGTTFTEGSGSYWNTDGSAQSYIPETSWNDSSVLGLAASGGGVSVFYPKPDWQTNTMPDGFRDVPDIALTASGAHDPYLICTGGDCNNWGAGTLVGGTSAATPVFAGILALINQYLGNSSSSPVPGMGNINRKLYSLQGATGVFHDIRTGNNVVSCLPLTSISCPSLPPYSFGYSAVTGYDQVTGLGSVDAYALAQAWSPTLSVALSVSPSVGNAPMTTMLVADTSGTAGGTLNFTFWNNCTDSSTSISEVMNSCGSIPTPSAGSCSTNSIGTKCNGIAATSQSATATYTSAGTYSGKVIVERGAAAPAEAIVPITVNTASTVSSTATALFVTPTESTFGAPVSLIARVSSNGGTPTGVVTFNDGSAIVGSGLLNNSGTANLTISSLAVGSDLITASYGGASAFSSSRSNGVTVTVRAVSPTIAVTPSTGTLGVTTFTKSGSGFSPNGPITHIATWPDGTKSVLNGYSDPTGSFNYTVTYSDKIGTYYQTDTDDTTGKTSNTISWTVSPVAVNDFSLSPSPSSETISQGGSATFSLVTSTISGSAQSVSLSASNTPPGMTVSFSQSVFASGGAVTFTVSAGSAVAAGTYLLTITGTGTSATHSSSVSVTVVQQQSSSAGSLTSSPSSFNFNPQTVDTASSPFVFSLVNSGGTAVTISSLTASPGFIPSFLNGLGLPITLQPNGGYANMQVVFIPTSVGTQTGTIKLFNSTNVSPLTISLSGSAVGAPLTTGNIQINATFNGSPWSGNLYTSLTGPESYTDGQTPITHTELAPGGYTESYSAGDPGGATLQSITPSASQTLTAGSTISFTYNFTGTNTFSIGGPQPITTVMGAGKSAQIQLPQLCLETGTAQTIQFAMQGLPLGASVAWSANPFSLTGCGQIETATITTGGTTPPGVYNIQIIGTNQSGSSSSTNAWLSVNLPPASPDVLVSVATNGAQGDGDSGGTAVPGPYNQYYPASVSADGHVVAFLSAANNLAPLSGSTIGTVSQIYVRDNNAGTTILASAAADGTQANYGALYPALSMDGRYVAFQSYATNLPNASSGGNNAIYVRDLSSGAISRVDMAPDGTPGNGISYNPSLSADGRFVAFNSTASNLIPGVNGGIFVLDRKTGQFKLASVSSDGSDETSGEVPKISASGRYVIFASSDPNLVPNDTNGRTDAFVHDFATGETTRVNVASDGTQDTCGVITTISSPLAISADGRYVAFESCGDVAQGYADPRGDGGDVYVHDMVTGQTSPLGIDQVNDLLNTQTVGGFSADGRFIAVNGSIIDQTTGEMTRADVLSDGSGSPAVTNTVFYGGDTTTAFLSADGSHTVFASNASNLVSNDNNGYFDVFEGVNSFLASPRLTSISLSANQAPGGTSVTGTLTLDAPAPIGGATVSVWTDNGSISVPATVTIPQGARSAPFNVTTSAVPAETVVAVLASYNGGSSVAVLALEPAAVLVTSPSSWNFGSVTVGTKSTAESFVLTNSGTAPLAIGAIQLVSGQTFTISANTCGSSIAPGGSCSVSVTFSPSATEAASDSVQISYESPAITQTISVSGQGASPVASLSPLPLSFGNQLMPGSSVGVATLTNNGSANLSSISTGISGSNAGDFTISADGCTGVILPANSSCSVSITFSPKAKGSRAATLSITDNASGSPQTAALTGTGIQSTPAILWVPPTVSLAYGTALGGVLNASAEENGSSLAGTFAYTATVSGGTPQNVSQSTVLTTGTYTIMATFTPTDIVDYTTATASVSITVAATSPVVNVVPGASSVSTTQPLAVAVTVSGGSGNPTPTGSVILTGGTYASAAALLIGGTATINIPANTLAAGNYTFKASYTPDSNSFSEYSSASGMASSSVKVTAPAPTMTVAPGASSITTTQAFSVTVILSGGSGNPIPTGAVMLTSGNYISAATSLSSGSATINIPANSLVVGTDTLSVAYGGDSIYSGTTATGSIVVTLSAASVTVAPANNGTFDSSQAETVAVSVAGAGPAPTGTVKLSGGGYTSASTALSSGSATISIPANEFTTAGSITLTANYSGDGIYASGSGTAGITVNAPYSLTTTNPSAINSGGNATATVTLTADPSYSGTVTLTCALSSNPPGAQDLPTCRVTSGSSINIANGIASGSTTITISTTAAGSASLDKHGIPGWAGAGGGTILALLVFLGIPARRRSWRNLLGLVVAMGALGTLSACGGGGSGISGGGGGSGANLGTTAGNYTFTVTGTGNPGVSPAPTATLKLTVN